MKIIKYLLITLGWVCILMSANASYWDDTHDVWRQPSPSTMSSTSAMRLSGTTLPQAVVSGTYTTYDMQISISGPNRIGGGNSGGGDGPTNPDDVLKTPISDIPWVMLGVLLLTYIAKIFIWKKEKA